MEQRTTLVLGASPNPARYSHMAVRRLREGGHAVIAVGRREGAVADVPILREPPTDRTIDTVTVYLNRENQREWSDAILGMGPRRIIFNPGAENPELAEEARSRGIEVIEGCTLVMLASDQF